MATEKDIFYRYGQQSWLDYWVNPYADDEPFNLAENGIYVPSFSGWGLPSPELSTVKSAYEAGEFISSEKLGIREMTMNISTDGCSREDYWATRAKLVRLLYNDPLDYGTIAGIGGYATLEVPQRWVTGAGDWEGHWENFYGSSRSADRVFSYGRGLRGPLMWKKEINGRGYHTYVHYTSGAEFSPRNLEEWHEWGIDETLTFTAFDPFIYLSDVRLVEFEQQANYGGGYVVVTDYYGNAPAYPIIELDGWGQELTSPGDYVTWTIRTDPVSSHADELALKGGEMIKIKVTYEDATNYDYPPELNSNTKLMVNLSPRGKGVYLVGRTSVGALPGDAFWSLWPAMWALDISDTSINTMRNFTTMSYGPAASHGIVTSTEEESPSGFWHRKRFEPTGTDEYGPGITFPYGCVANGTTDLPVKGAMTFYETYGGI